MTTSVDVVSPETTGNSVPNVAEHLGNQPNPSFVIPGSFADPEQDDDDAPTQPLPTPDRLPDDDKHGKGDKRGVNMRRLTPEDLATDDGIHLICSRLHVIFRQLEIAGDPEKLKGLIDQYTQWQLNLGRHQLGRKLEAIRSQLGMSDEDFKAQLAMLTGSSNSEDSEPQQPTTTTPTSGKSTRKSSAVSAGNSRAAMTANGKSIS